jgi:hypothetical protein
VAPCRYRVILGMSLPRQLGCGVILLPSHASDVAAEATWSWSDVDVESC